VIPPGRPFFSSDGSKLGITDQVGSGARIADSGKNLRPHVPPPPGAGPFNTASSALSERARYEPVRPPYLDGRPHREC